jgi:hypothetical protein
MKIRDLQPNQRTSDHLILFTIIIIKSSIANAFVGYWGLTELFFPQRYPILGKE